MVTNPKQGALAAPREYHFAKWNVGGLLRAPTQSLPISQIARELNCSDSNLFLYMRNGETPLSVYKALVMLLDPARDDKLVVQKKTKPSRLPFGVLRWSRKYDKAHPGKKFGIKGGGTIQIPQDAASLPELVAEVTPAKVTEVEATPTAPEPPLATVEATTEQQELTVPTPFGAIKILVPQARRTDSSDDLLLAIATRLKAERDDAYREIATLQKSLKTAQQQVIMLQEQLRQKDEEVAVYEELMKEQSIPQGEKAVKISATPEVVDNTRQLLQQKAPGLVDILDSLPKTAALRA